MKLKAITSWKYDFKLEGLLFFVQLVDEMLFDYTLDSYKVPALNTRLLCTEARLIISDINKGVLRRGALSPIIKELSRSLEKDTVAQRLIGPKYKLYCKSFDSETLSLSDAETMLKSMNRFFSEKKYFQEAKTQLIEAIKDGGKKKESITELTRLLLTDIINLRYSQSYIYHSTHRFFFNDKYIIRDIKQLEDFFEIFDFEEKEFTVVFKGSKIFDLLKDACSHFKVDVVKTLEHRTSYQPEKDYLSNLEIGESFLICKDIKALDHYNARRFAEGGLEIVADLFGYYNHQVRPQWSKSALTYRVEDSNIIIDEQKQPIFRQKGEDAAVAASKIKKLIDLPNVLSKSSFNRIAHAIDLHGMALEAPSIENQLLDFWATIETLIPLSYSENKDRIAQISDSLVPFLQIHYINKLVKNFMNDLRKWNQDEFIKLIKKIPEKGLVKKTAALIALKSNESLRDEIYKQLAEFPLLKNRMFMLHSALSNAASIKMLLESHTERVEWHLRRIYRTRNMIIHSGQAPTYTGLLVEHLHSYLDIVFDQIIEMAYSEKKIQTIEEAVLEARLSIEQHFDVLKQYSKKECDSSNLNLLLFGDYM